MLSVGASKSCFETALASIHLPTAPTSGFTNTSVLS